MASVCTVEVAKYDVTSFLAFNLDLSLLIGQDVLLSQLELIF